MTDQLPAIPSEFTEQDLKLLSETIAKKATHEELKLFARICNKTKLDPFSRQIYFVKRWDTTQGKEVMTAQCSIDGFRVVAQRSGQYAGQSGPFWCAQDGKWVDVWLRNEAPSAAKVGVLRHGFKDPIWAVARFDAYAQKNKEGKLFPMWAKMPDLMIAKCAESLALRRAFPQELSGLYTGDEMGQAEIEPVEETEKKLAPIKPKTIPSKKPEPTFEDFNERRINAKEEPPHIKDAKIPFGKLAGKAMSEMTDDELDFFVKNCEQFAGSPDVDTPKKLKDLEEAILLVRAFQRDRRGEV